MNVNALVKRAFSLVLALILIMTAVVAFPPAASADDQVAMSVTEEQVESADQAASPEPSPVKLNIQLKLDPATGKGEVESVQLDLETQSSSCAPLGSICVPSYNYFCCSGLSCTSPLWGYCYVPRN